MVLEQTTLEVQSSNFSDARYQEKVMIQQNIDSQEIIVLSSDSEEKTSEPKICDDSLWKLRPAKKCSKYGPKEIQVKTDKENEGWLKNDIRQTLKTNPTPLNPSERLCCLRTHGLLKEAMSKGPRLWLLVFPIFHPLFL